MADNLRNRYLVRYLHDPTSRQLTLEAYPGKPGGEEAGESPVYSIWYENLCQLPDVHAAVMQTDFAAEVNLTVMRVVAEAVSRG